jgi:hypothetical protein
MSLSKCLSRSQVRFKSNLIANPTGRIVDQFSSVLEAKLRFDMTPVGINSFDAQMKVSGNLVRLFSLTDQTQDFELTVSQFGSGWCIRFFASGREIIKNLCGDPVTH